MANHSIEPKDERNVIRALAAVGSELRSGQSGGVVLLGVILSNHLAVPCELLGALGEIVPDLEPLSVVLVDLLTTDLDLDVADQSVTDAVHVVHECGAAGPSDVLLEGGQGHLQVHVADEITISADGSGDPLSEICCV